MKICGQCEKEKSFNDFYNSAKSKDGKDNWCKPCRSLNDKKYKGKNNDKLDISDHAYLNSEKGFVTSKFCDIYTPSRCKRRGLWPAVSKKRLWEMFSAHVEKYGHKCIYCFTTWTYKRRQTKRGIGKPRARGKTVTTNFSIDRLDNSLTYTEENTVFCCQACNDEKHSIGFKLLDRIQELRHEKKI